MNRPNVPGAVLALLLLAAAGCSREEAAPAGTSTDVGADAPAAPAAPTDDALREQVGSLMGGEGLPATTGTALDARPLAGQAEIGVRSLLGNPDSCKDIATGRTCRYARGGTEVTYIDGMADWIIVDDLGGAPFSAAALAKVGLPVDEPMQSSPQMLRWENHAGFRQITLYPDPQGRAGRLEMKMATL